MDNLRHPFTVISQSDQSCEDNNMQQTFIKKDDPKVNTKKMDQSLENAWMSSVLVCCGLLLLLHKKVRSITSLFQELCEDIGSLEIMYLSEQALEGVLQSFNSYVTMMIHALPSSVETENLEGSTRRIVKMA
ncbi:hypothetical protein ACS0TY_012231 [Phlomoides rotata]